MKLSPRDQLIIAIVAIVLVTGVAIFMLVVPQFGRLKQLDTDIAKADQEIQQAQALLNRRQGAKSQAAYTQAQLIRLANELPDAPELPSLIIELQDTANESGLEFSRIIPETPKVDTGYSTLGLALNMRGEWSDIIEFSRRVSRLRRQVRVTSVTLVPVQGAASEEDTTTDEDAPQLVDATLRVEAYMLASTVSSATP